MRDFLHAQPSVGHNSRKSGLQLSCVGDKAEKCRRCSQERAPSCQVAKVGKLRDTVGDEEGVRLRVSQSDRFSEPGWSKSCTRKKNVQGKENCP